MSSSAGRAAVKWPRNAASSAWVQNIPAVSVIIGAMTVMGVAQDLLHRLGHEGEVSGCAEQEPAGGQRQGAGQAAAARRASLG
jgi:hypothetical protein